jgi:hypothetical protein
VSDPSAELSDALEVALRADAPLAALFVNGTPRVYDLPPENAPFPYFTLDDVHVQSQAAQGFDGTEANQNLHAWSRTDPAGARECKAIAAAAVAALDGAVITLPSFRVVQLRWVDTRFLLEADGQTVHGVIRFAISTDPA